MKGRGSSNHSSALAACSLSVPALWATSVLVGVVAGSGDIVFRGHIRSFS